MEELLPGRNERAAGKASSVRCSGPDRPLPWPLPARSLPLPPPCVWEAQGFFLTRSALEARLGRAWEDAGIVMERLTWARHHGDLLAEQRGRAAKAEGLRSWHCGGSC